MQWNALKLLNANGEFLDNATAAAFIALSENPALLYKDVTKIGTYTTDDNAIQRHIEHVLSLPLVDVAAIKSAGFKVALDGVNSTGGLAVVPLLKALGVKTVNELYCSPDGKFPHNPEPLPENLQELAQTVIKTKSHVGFAVDPDVDRLAIVDENGEMFGEEYTLVAVADYIMQHKKGNSVSNLSSTSALRDVTLKHGGKYYPSAVGEVNVVEMMKNKKAVIGGEGNGGVIYPELHYGRDALAGIALFLSHLAKAKMSCSRLRQTYPDYYISKNKIEVRSETEINTILKKIQEKYIKQPINTVDGVRIDFDNAWVHLRRSNTEPIIRIYAESDSMNKSEVLAHKLVEDIRDILKLETEE
jgi:phosphomannomutase